MQLDFAFTGNDPQNHGKRALFVVMLAVVLSACAFGQTNTGSIVGTVRDPTGAVVPGAHVNVTNEATNVTVSFVTNTAGDGVR